MREKNRKEKIVFDISKVDSNFEINTQINKKDIKFYNIDEAPFEIYGVLKENGRYRRMPEDVAKTVSDGVYMLHSHTSGGRVRFATDSQYVAISAKIDSISRAPHSTLTGAAGFDMYVGEKFIYTFVPPYTVETEYESLCERFGTREMREITINFPLFSNVSSLYIGLQEDAVVKKASPYKNKKPVVYYGSSITQGGCASRPGNCYTSIISRKFDYDYINLGFSGNAKAEDEIAEYIKGINMSLFVYDYDHNSPSTEHLKNTHEKMFKTIRTAHPKLPIIIMGRPKYTFYFDDEQRTEIVKKTYKNAIASGDKNVYFIDGPTLLELCKDDYSVDACHPNDFGFASMAKALAEVIADIDVK